MNIKLRAKRVERGLSQTELAEKLKMSLSTYSHKETGKYDFTLSEIQDLMYYLDCDFDEIFFKKEIANKCEI
jgi:DNA-binding XRE family transcriptional regulator